MTRFVAAMLIVMMGSGVAHGRTWRVEKDGSGDYAVIQDALDAAASGDTIRIGPGRYEDFREYPTNGGLQAVIAMIQVPVMTLIGAGADRTVIGPDVYDWDGLEPVPRGVVCIAQPPTGHVRIESMALENMVSGVLVENAGPLSVSNCRFSGGRRGIDALVSADVSHSHFADQFYGVLGYPPAQEVEVFDCTFEYTIGGQCILFQGVPTGTATRCRFVACDSCFTVGVTYDGGGGGIYDCTFEGLLRSIYLSSVSYPTISGNQISTWGTCLFSNSELFNAENNSFQSTGSSPTIQLFTRGLLHHISGNDILRGTGLAVEIVGHTGPDGYHLDLTDNWWGTTDPDSIAAWIHDGNDVRYPPMNVTVDFAPFLDRSVPNEQESLGGLKALFLGR